MSDYLAQVARLGVPDGAPSGAEILPRTQPATADLGWAEPPASAPAPEGAGIGDKASLDRLLPTTDAVTSQGLATEPARLEPPDMLAPTHEVAHPEPSAVAPAVVASGDAAISTHVDPIVFVPTASAPAEGPGVRAGPLPAAAALAVSAIAAEAQAPSRRAVDVTESAVRETSPRQHEPPVVGIEPQTVPAPMLRAVATPLPAVEPPNVEVTIGRVEIEVRQPKERRTRPLAMSAPTPGRFDRIAASRRLQDRRWY